MLTVTLSQEESKFAIAKLCEYVRFPTVSSLAVESGAYKDCADWILQQLQFLDEAYLLPESPDHSPVVVAVWKGRDERLPVLLLNSHYDVVPAEIKDWTVPPFDGLCKDGKIYGRGTQDMKCVGIQYILAIAKLGELRPDFQPERSVYLTFVPDEGSSVQELSALLRC